MLGFLRLIFRFILDAASLRLILDSDRGNSANKWGKNYYMANFRLYLIVFGWMSLLHFAYYIFQLIFFIIHFL